MLVALRLASRCSCGGHLRQAALPVVRAAAVPARVLSRDGGRPGLPLLGALTLMPPAAGLPRTPALRAV